MSRKLFSFPFISIRGRSSASPPPLSKPGYSILYHDTDSGLLLSSTDGKPYDLIRAAGSDGYSAAGPMGPAGPAGVAGPAGTDGAAGTNGNDGATGPAGAKGDTGLTGATGPAGPAGPAGAKGDTGLTGATGPAGAKGDTGLTGATGLTGPAGLDGAKGDTGLTGVIGPTGPAGPAGESIIGPAGPAGESIIGPAGPAGESIIGPAGPAGPAGESIIGPAGPTGPAGESIIGPAGPTGPAGESIIGPAGPAGPAGESVDPAAFYAHRGSNLSLWNNISAPAGTHYFALPFNSERYDTGNLYNLAYYNVPVTGVYEFHVSVCILVSATEAIRAQIILDDDGIVKDSLSGAITGGYQAESVSITPGTNTTYFVKFSTQISCSSAINVCPKIAFTVPVGSKPLSASVQVASGGSTTASHFYGKRIA